MYKKILIANRGEIAVRILRTCREMGILSVALYQPSDVGSLHVRLADECVPLTTPAGFRDAEAMIAIAKAKGADAIHPGIGFLAEEADFAQACAAAGLTFIGPPPATLDGVRSKVAALKRAREAGFPVLPHSAHCLPSEAEAARAEAEKVGYPLVIKSCRGGRGRGERLVRTPDRFDEALRRAQKEALAVYGDSSVYLERALIPTHQLGVQVLADAHGNLIHLGEREGSLIYGNQKVIEESPAPSLNPAQRQQLWQMALDLARLFNVQGAATIEFLLDKAGQFYFTEIKARLQVEHPVTEMVTRVDLVREQIRIAAGERLARPQSAVALTGWGMVTRLTAEDPWRRFLPSPGLLRRVRLPSGPEVRVDTYVYSGCEVPAEYDPLIAKLTVWGEDRAACLARLKRALMEFKLVGTSTNLPLLQRIVQALDFEQGTYDSEFLAHPFDHSPEQAEQFRDLAAVAALLFARRTQAFTPSTPERLSSGWHRDSRRLPQ
jgi:acetyl/propionyl-CoA carboxylase alpha subunit